MSIDVVLPAGLNTVEIRELIPAYADVTRLFLGVKVTPDITMSQWQDIMRSTEVLVDGLPARLLFWHLDDNSVAYATLSRPTGATVCTTAAGPMILYIDYVNK